MTNADPLFPPLINGIRTAAEADPFDVACRAAAAGDAGAGDLYWSPSETTLSLALVVEPDVPAPAAMDMVFIAMVAFGDCVGALAPPEVGVTYRWPQTLLANGARVGSVIVKLPPEAADGELVGWMVMGLRAEISPQTGMPEPGLYLDRTTLWDEGCGGLTRTELLKSFVRHLKTWLHRWEIDGVRPVREAWLARAPQPGEPVTFISRGKEQEGFFLGLDEAGNMLVKSAETTLVADLAASLRPDPYAPAGAPGS